MPNAKDQITVKAFEKVNKMSVEFMVGDKKKNLSFSDINKDLSNEDLFILSEKIAALTNYQQTGTTRTKNYKLVANA